MPPPPNHHEGDIMNTKHALALMLVAVLAVGIGANPRFIEELKIGGGFGEAADGGADFEKDGDIVTDGNVTAGSFIGSGALLTSVPVAAHATTHVDGTDDIQDATASQKGLMTAAYGAKLDGVEAGAQVTSTAKVEAAMPLDDGTALVLDSTGNGKVRIEAGSVASGVTRAITMPDQDIDLTPNQTFQAHDGGLDDIAALSPVKGKLIVGNGTDWSELPLGSDGQQLEADSAIGIGVKWSSAGGAGDTLPVDDTKSVVRDPGDNTKQMRIDVGVVATSTTRVLTMPNQDIDLTPGTGAFQAADTNIAKVNAAQEWTQAQNFNATTLTDGATVSWDAQSNQVASVTLAGNRTLANPTNLVDGGTYMLVVKQDGTGGRTLSFSSAYKFPAGVTPSLTSTANAVDIFSFVSDGTNMYGVGQFDFS